MELADVVRDDSVLVVFLPRMKTTGAPETAYSGRVEMEIDPNPWTWNGSHKWKVGDRAGSNVYSKRLANSLGRSSDIGKRCWDELSWKTDVRRDLIMNPTSGSPLNRDCDRRVQ